MKISPRAKVIIDELTIIARMTVVSTHPHSGPTEALCWKFIAKLNLLGEYMKDIPDKEEE